MIACKVLISILFLILSGTTKAYDVKVDFNTDYVKVSGLSLGIKSQYFPTIAAGTDIKDYFLAELDTLLGTPPDTAGFWIDSNNQRATQPDPKVPLPEPIVFSWNENIENFDSISLKYYYYNTANGVNLANAELTFPNAATPITVPLPPPLLPSPPNEWSVTEFFKIQTVKPNEMNQLKIDIDLAQTTNNVLNYFVLDSVTFRSKTDGGDCRPENQNTYTPNLIIYGGYFTCYFNSNYNLWFLARYMCPVVQNVQHVYCKSGQECRLPTATCA